MIFSVKFVLESEVRNLTFRRMPNVLICYISVTLDINFHNNSAGDFKDA